MTRQCMYVFIGAHRGAHTPHESPRIMTVPLVILAVFALGLGGLARGSVLAKLPGETAHHTTVVLAVSIAVALGGILLGWLIYRGRALGQAADPLAVTPLVRKLWFDELYAATCLLYNSDAAAYMQGVDLGGRRIIKKQKSKVTN